jgi:regulator of sirC expression with transglutaminase-like and TPR domain
MRFAVACRVPSLVAPLVALTCAVAAEPRRSVEELARDLRRSVVTIRYSGRGDGDRGLGTGFVVAADGLVATNLHVIGEARPITVELDGGTKHDVVAVHASDRASDLAIVRIDARDLVPLELGDPATLADGSEVVAIGNPHGLEKSIVAGRVSGRRDVDGLDMIQLAIPIEPGNSGGPLVDLAGRVQGVMTMKSLVTPNLGFAVAADRLRLLLDGPNPVTMDRWLTIGAIDAKEWTLIGGARWRQRAGQISVSGAGRGFGGRSLCLSVEEPPAPTYEIAVRVKLDDEAGAAGLAFAADGGDRHYGFYPSGGKLRFTRFNGADVFSWTVLGEKQVPEYRPGEWNHLRVRREPGKILCYVNDALVFDSADDGLQGGRVGLVKFRETQAEFRGFTRGIDLPRAMPADDLVDRVAAIARDLPASGMPPAEIVGRLLPEGPAASLALEVRAAALEREAARVRGLAAAVDDRRALDAFAKAVEGDEAAIDLFRAALLVSKLDNPDLDVDASCKELDRLAEDIAARLPPDADESAKLAMLNRVLFDELGFHGSRGDYYNRSNSYVNEVLDDREGIPISLAVVYMELAKHLGLAVHGVGFPGHFLVRHDPAAGEPRFIDVFDRAKPLSRDDLARLARRSSDRPFTDAHLAVVGPRAILARMLRNLENLAERDRDTDDVLRYLDAILFVEPDSVRDRVMRMATAHRAGRRETALADARWILDNSPDDIDLDQVRRLVDMLEHGDQR